MTSVMDVLIAADAMLPAMDIEVTVARSGQMTAKHGQPLGVGS